MERRKHKMKLEEALRKAIMRSGAEVLGEKRLLFILSDFRAFDEYPAARQVLEAIVSSGSGKELARLFLDEDRDWCLSYARDLRKSLSGKNHFREDLADYAVGSILFALGLQDFVTEPSDHGFDPVEHGSGATGSVAGSLKDQVAEEGKYSPDERSSGSAEGKTAGASWRKNPGLKEQEFYVRSSEDAADGRAALLNAGAKGSSKAIKWGIAALLLAGAFAGGWLASSSSREEGGVSSPRTAVSATGSTGAHGSNDTQDTGAAGISADAAKSGGNDAPMLPAQEEYVPEKAYYLGSGSIADASEEAERLRKSAEQGNALAQNNLGVMYAEGLGVIQDDAEALKWLRKSAEQGNPAGEVNLGTIYARGSGVSRDYAEAVRLNRKSAEPGDAVSLFSIGLDYAVGAGVTKDPAEAVKWFRKAAEHGNADAQATLGGMYLTGSGVTKDYAEALKWSRKSAELGNAHGEFNLGEIYEYGFGVNRNLAEAWKWYTKAEAHGNILAESVIRSLDISNSSYASGSDAGRAQGGAAADDDPGGVRLFGRMVYLFGEMDECSWDRFYNKCLLRKTSDGVYMATARMETDMAPYKFRFCDADCTPGTSFGYAPESKPGVYDFAKGTPIRLNPHTRFSGENEVIKVIPPHDGMYDFYLDVSGGVLVTYVREHR